MDAASLETSEPDMFIAIPKSAFLRAGESLTPSPVTPTLDTIYSQYSDGIQVIGMAEYATTRERFRLKGENNNT